MENKTSNVAVVFVLKWYENYFVSPLVLQKAFESGILTRCIEETQYGAYYAFYSLSGTLIAKIYKDHGWGFSSQAYGFKLGSEAVADTSWYKLKY